MASLVVAVLLFLIVIYLYSYGFIALLDYWTGLAVALTATALGILYWGFKPRISELFKEKEKLQTGKAKPKEVKKEQEQTPLTQEKEAIEKKETIVVSPNESYFYEFELLRNDRVKGDISSTTRLDIYFLDEVNFDKWDRDRSFYPENCNEGILETSIDYEAPRKGTWYVVIENNGRKSGTVKISLSVLDGNSLGTGYIPLS